MNKNLGPYAQLAIPSNGKDTDEFWRSVLRTLNAHKNWEFFINFIDSSFDIESGTLISSANVFSLLSLGIPLQGPDSQLDLQNRVTTKVWNLALKFSESLTPPLEPLILDCILAIIRSGKRCERDTRKFSCIVFDACMFKSEDEKFYKKYTKDLNIIFQNNQDVILLLYEDFDEISSKIFHDFLYLVSR